MIYKVAETASTVDKIHDLLEAYSEADTSKDVVRVQNEFLESKE